MNSKPAKIADVSTEGGLLTVWLDDGRILSLPLAWYPSLSSATPAEQAAWQTSGAGRGVHWPALDYDLGVEGLLEGRHEHPSALRYVRQTRALNPTSKTPKPRVRQQPRRPRTKSGVKVHTTA